MTYESIVKLLHDHNLKSTAGALDYAIYEEKKALLTMVDSPYKKRDAGRAALKAAQEFYAEDITRQIVERQDLTPDRVLGQRRFPTVWAIVEIASKHDVF